MSDFDKEAEREKLREQFEAEEADRKHTQQMSELLLKGATMTNAHCEECGDPIFRYDGQTFCPTCQAPAEGQGQQAGGQSAPQGGQQPGNQEQADATEEAAEPAREPESEPTPERGDARADAAGSSEPLSQGDGVAQPGAPRAAGSEPRATPDRTDPDRAPSDDRGGSGAVGGPAAGDGDVGEAAAALRSTLTKFSRKAAEADDPRRAREYLAAAREAAEALDALPY
ncbi:hypothetical protein G9464_00915 [Halostella sp. JP-L12]|uniref:Sjogren's syndrome/scleroderma autoantigen 1 family protein n=1 Tax=Halostella TaxID=1843185 RepID=UPI000EF83376|nr:MULTISPECIES: Sjogren's syndrome/scleroderma autoantigen 1 family protein [Halostella]NHN46160.1 hypothetical protein [Halostella sp. JP-L12]